MIRKILKFAICFVFMLLSCDPPGVPTPQAGACLLLGPHDYVCEQGYVDNLVRVGLGAIQAHVRSTSSTGFTQRALYY